MFNNHKRTGVSLVILLLAWVSIYSQDFINKSAAKYYPEYHFFPSIDPTGLSYYGGKYFLNWGTAVSKDLVHWEMTEYGTERNKMIVGIFGSLGIELFSNHGEVKVKSMELWELDSIDLYQGRINVL